MHLQHTLENCFSLHTQPYWFHYLLIPTAVCKQQQAKVSPAYQNNLFLSGLKFFGRIAESFCNKRCDKGCSLLTQESERRQFGSMVWDSNRSFIQLRVTNVPGEQNMQDMHCISDREGRVNPLNTWKYFRMSLLSLHKPYFTILSP